MKNKQYITPFFFLLLFSLSSCVNDKAPGPDGDFPKEIADIMIKKCATAGCHTTQSKEASSGLDCSSWDVLFDGNRNGAVVVPFRSDHSTVFFIVNRDTLLGPTLLPVMPYNEEPLSVAEVNIIKEWIDNGAPNKRGEIPFSGNAVNRQKYYVTNQGCDEVAVFDAKRSVIMRFIKVGVDQAIESPHQIKVSPDGKYWYVVFLNSSVLQKFDATTDQLVGQANIGNGSWNTLTISGDGKWAYACDFRSGGSIAIVDLEAMTSQRYFGFTLAHGTAISPDDETLYVTAQIGNFLYKVDVSDPENPDFGDELSLNGLPPSSTPSLNIHEVSFSPDGSKFVVTCERTNEIRFFDTNTETLLATLPTGVFPQEIAFSKSTNYLFITCMEDNQTYTGPGQRGSVYIYDYSSMTFVKHVYTGYQPHGVAVDDGNGYCYVANRNYDGGGPAPHHVTECGGTNGYMTRIRLSDLEVDATWKNEVSVDPYSVAVRF